MTQTNAVSQVAQLIQQASQAQQQLESYNQTAVDELVTAVAWALVNPENNKMLSELAVAETGLGNVADKITKNHRKTLGLLRDLKDAKTVGVIRRDPEQGIVEIARSVGVVGAIVPSTNPIAYKHEGRPGRDPLYKIPAHRREQGAAQHGDSDYTGRSDNRRGRRKLVTFTALAE